MTKPKRLYTNICRVCSKEFHPHSRNQPTCSVKCGTVLRSATRRKRTTRHCAVCSKPFEVKAYRANAKYCSRDCWSVRNPPKEKTCPHCGISFVSHDRKAIYCSRTCARKDKTGENAPAWKGGKATHRTRSKYRGELAQWRKAVFGRDNYTCQICSTNGEDIHAHHIKPLAEFPEIALDIDNGQTLCIPCHEEIHGRKMSSPSKYPKQCIDCGAETSGRSYRCRSCSSIFAHLGLGHNQPKTCPQCNKVFIGRSDQTFCCISCGLKYRHARSNNSGSNPIPDNLSKHTETYGA